MMTRLEFTVASSHLDKPRSRRQRDAGAQRSRRRPLRCEILEDRRLLAGVTVDTDMDLSDGDTSSIANLLSNNGPDGKISLREAITAANNTGGTDTIDFDFATPQTITLGGTELAITDSIIIDGPGPAGLSIDAGGDSRVFHVDDGAATYSDVEIKNVTITGGQSNEGGGIQSFENLSLDNVVVSNNRAMGSNADGGGIGQGNETRFGGSLTINNSHIVDNVAEDDASAIDFYNSVDLTITNSEIARNQSIDNFSDDGGTVGAIRGIDTIASATGATLVLFDNVTVDDNTIMAGSDSGAVGAGASFSDGGNNGIVVEIRNSTISGNVQQSGSAYFISTGGGLSLTGLTSFTLTNSIVSGNRSQGVGGGINAYRIGTMDVIDSAISGNHSYRDGGGGDGGGIYASRIGTMDVINSEISGNFANDDGGGIYVRYGTSTITNSTISGNSAKYGGGIHNAYPMTVTDSTIAGNYAMRRGGGIYNSSTMTVTDSTIAGNSTMDRGGGIQNNGMLTITNSTISGNSAFRGGGIENRYDMIITSSTITGNAARSQGGGIYNEYNFFSNAATVTKTIVAGNRNLSGESDVEGTADLNPASAYNLIGDAGTSGGLTNGVNGNITGVDWRTVLANDGTNPTLADNGGLTQTIALLVGSPAIDAGDPAAMPGVGDVPEYDQRGMPFGRVQDGNGDMTARIDMGAFEVQATTGPACDFDGIGGCDIADIDALVMAIASGTYVPLYDLSGNGFLDLADRDAWLADAGALNLLSGNPYLVGDANLDGGVDGQDFILWNAHKFTTTGRWSEADWDANGVTDGQDFILWNARKFQSSDASARIVPPGTDLDHRQLAAAAGVRSTTRSRALPASDDPPQSLAAAQPIQRPVLAASHVDAIFSRLTRAPVPKDRPRFNHGLADVPTAALPAR